MPLYQVCRTDKVNKQMRLQSLKFVRDTNPRQSLYKYKKYLASFDFGSIAS